MNRKKIIAIVGIVVFVAIAVVAVSAMSADEDLPCNEGEYEAGETVTVEAGCVVSGDISVVHDKLFGNNEYEPLFDHDPHNGLVTYFAQDTDVYFPYGGSVWPEGTTLEEAANALLVDGCLTGCTSVTQETVD